MAKTVVQEIKQRFELLARTLPQNNEHNIAVIETYKRCAKIAEELLEEEKKQIVKAVRYGIVEGGFIEDSSLIESKELIVEMTEDYYLTHYTTDLNVDEIAKDRFESE